MYLSKLGACGNELEDVGKGFDSVVNAGLGNNEKKVLIV